MSILKNLPANIFVEKFSLAESGVLHLDSARRLALETLLKCGFPSRENEAWKYTNIEPITGQSFIIPQNSGKGTYKPIPNTYSLVYIDGIFSPSASSLPPGESGVSIRQFNTEIIDKSGSLAKSISADSRNFNMPFAVLNAAFVSNGAVIDVVKNCQLDKPLHLVNISSIENSLVNLRFILNLGSGSQVQIFEEYITAGSAVAFTNSVTEINLGKNSFCRHGRNQSQNRKSFHVGKVIVSQERDSQYHSTVLSCGAEISRLDLITDLKESGATAILKGLYAVKEKQLVDNHTQINHLAGRTFSEQVYQGILADRSHGVFNGKVSIAKDAQLVESSQLNKNLMLSKNARIDTKPELDVHANDVKAAHGAAIGQLNEDELFYIQSRCISKDDAMAMLVHGHMSEIIEAVNDVNISAYLGNQYSSLFEN